MSTLAIAAAETTSREHPESSAAEPIRAGVLAWPSRVPQRIVAWLGLALVVSGVGIGLLVSSIGAVGTGELALDVSISQHRAQPWLLTSEWFSNALGPIAGPLIVAAICAVVWFRDRAKALALGVLTAAGWLSVGIAKIVFQRARPPADLVHAVLVENGKDSFPSGHTALVAAAFTAATVVLWTAGRRLHTVVTLGVVAVLLMGASRMYLGVHYLGDVLAAPLFAVGAVLIASWLIPNAALRLRRSGTGRTAASAL